MLQAADAYRNIALSVPSLPKPTHTAGAPPPVCGGREEVSLCRSFRRALPARQVNICVDRLAMPRAPPCVAAPPHGLYLVTVYSIFKFQFFERDKSTLKPCDKNDPFYPFSDIFQKFPIFSNPRMETEPIRLTPRLGNIGLTDDRHSAR